MKEPIYTVGPDVTLVKDGDDYILTARIKVDKRHGGGFTAAIDGIEWYSPGHTEDNAAQGYVDECMMLGEGLIEDWEKEVNE